MLIDAALVRQDAAVFALCDEWRALWRRSPHAGPFQSPEWLLPWWQHFGNGRPRVAVLRDGARLEGVLPLYELDGRLLPIGAGITDYQDALLAPDLDARAASTLLRAALTDLPCDLTDVPESAALRTAEPPKGWRAEWRQSDPCPVLTLTGESIPSAMRRKLRMNRNRADRAGGVSVEIAGASALTGHLDALIRLHARRWNGAGKPGVLEDERVRAFHREAAPLLLAAGSLRIAVLWLRETIVAACYTLLHRDARILFYLNGYDPAHAHFSPGSLLVAHLIAQAREEGRREADFLRGGEAYKYAWGATDRWNASCRLTPI